ncbi:MAG: hypothetical protein DWQ19_09225 [Crenarchaeota archaeon]|nr:MAG: hypothetical protein DWQ19_09225 [Thermoproteota archaeon]
MLDPYGYWQYPCRTCAEDFDLHQAETKEKIRQEMIERGENQEVINEYINDPWLNDPAWPRADQDVEKLIKDSAFYFAELEREAMEADREFEEMFGIDLEYEYEN